MPLPLTDAIRARVDEALAALSLDEKIAMLSGHGFFENFAETQKYCAIPYHIGGGNERLNLPAGRFVDGPRGVVTGQSTCFPVSMARGAAFDPELEFGIGDAIGRECRAWGANLFGGVCINLLRHPAWGRAQETYGEDPHHLGELGAALVRGVQQHNVIATVKHFAANSMENARFEVNVEADDRTLNEVYLPHFKRCLEAGAGAVMSAYNQLNGAYCGHNHRLLTDILRERWGFEGFVYSDFVRGCYGPDACAAGLDVEAPDTMHFGSKLRDAVEAGTVSGGRIDEAVRYVLQTLLRFTGAPDPERYNEAQIACPAHVELAQRAAEESMVLLKNEGVLPWSPDRVRTLAVIGPLADRINLGDRGSSNVRPPTVVTFAAGFRDYANGTLAVHVDDGSDLTRAQALAARVDAVVLAVGTTHRNEGEFITGNITLNEDQQTMPDADTAARRTVGGDRDNLGLEAAEVALIEAVAASNPRHLVAIMSGSAIIVEPWIEQASAVLMTWYPGMRGGSALARLVFGDVCPSGKLPFTVPTTAEHLPYFDKNAKEIRYDRYHGYTKLDRDGVQPAFPFGFGLSYTAFQLGAPILQRQPSAIDVQVAIRNTGSRRGAEVVQLYVASPGLVVDRPKKLLKAFQKVWLDPGEAREVRLSVPLDALRYFDPATDRWQLETGTYSALIGTSSSDSALNAVAFEL